MEHPYVVHVEADVSQLDTASEPGAMSAIQTTWTFRVKRRVPSFWKKSGNVMEF
jgi:hypothetical protein